MPLPSSSRRIAVLLDLALGRALLENAIDTPCVADEEHAPDSGNPCGPDVAGVGGVGWERPDQPEHRVDEDEPSKVIAELALASAA